MKKTLIALAVLALTAASASAQTTTAPGAATITTGTNANQNARHARMAGKGDMAQGKKSPAEKADHKAAKMAKELGLNADQEARVESLLLAQAQEMKTLKAKYAGTTNHDAMRPEAKALHDKYEGQLKTILGADAYARYDKMHDEHHDKGKGGHGPKDGQGKMKAKS
jgi:protein CpxP